MSTLNQDLASLKIDQSARAGGGRRSALVALLLVALLAAGGVWYWSTRVEAVSVTTGTVVTRTGAGATPGSVLNASGYVTARRRATVSSKVTGKVLEVFVEEGKSVQKGQVLARLDDAQAKASLAVAEAQLESARRGAAESEARLREAELTLTRRQQLVKDKVIGAAEVDSARAEVGSLKARIAMAEQQITVAESIVNERRTDLVDMVVRAPFDGVAISKDAQPGEMISPVSAGGGFTRTGICTLVDMTSLEVEVDVSEQYINRVTAGQPVEAVLDAYADWRIPAHVITTVPSADRQKATVRVRIGFGASASSGSKGEPLDRRILPDMGVKVSFFNDRPAAPEAAPRARILVPKAAIRAADGKSLVFVVRADRVEQRAITVGVADGDAVEVASGLSGGEQVVMDPPATLADGAKVAVKER